MIETTVRCLVAEAVRNLRASNLDMAELYLRDANILLDNQERTNDR